MPNNLLDEKMLQCFAALPTKLYSEVSHVGPAGQSRIAILFSSIIFSRHLQHLRWRCLLMNSQRARKEKKKKKFGRIRKLQLWTDVRLISFYIFCEILRFHSRGCILLIRNATYRFLLVLLTVSLPRLTPSFASSDSSSTMNTTSALGFPIGAPRFQI